MKDMKVYQAIIWKGGEVVYDHLFATKDMASAGIAMSPILQGGGGNRGSFRTPPNSLKFDIVEREVIGSD